MFCCLAAGRFLLAGIAGLRTCPFHVFHRNCHADIAGKRPDENRIRKKFLCRLAVSGHFRHTDPGADPTAGCIWSKSGIFRSRFFYGGIARMGSNDNAAGCRQFRCCGRAFYFCAFPTFHCPHSSPGVVYGIGVVDCDCNRLSDDAGGFKPRVRDISGGRCSGHK